MKRVFISALILLIVTQAGLAQNASPESVPLRVNLKKAELKERLNTTVPHLLKEGDVPGLSIAIIKDGKIFLNQGFGVMSASSKEPVNDNTVFEAASLSKPVFAYAVLKLVDAGKLDLDKPLVQYLGKAYIENDDRQNLITARRVLTHTTGFRTPPDFPIGAPKASHSKLFFLRASASVIRVKDLSFCKKLSNR
jgi:CubicO group peptidase (beta-lactamase class C family)